MEREITRRRKPAIPREKYPLVHQLVILVRSYKELKAMGSELGFAMRAAVLANMALDGTVALSKEGTVMVERAPTREIEKELAYKISHSRLSVAALLKALNGEGPKGLAVKKFRSKIYRELEKGGILRTEKTLLYKKVTLENQAVWQDIKDLIISECCQGVLSAESKLLLIALNYTNRMESLLLFCGEHEAQCVRNIFRDLCAKVKCMAFTPSDKFLFLILEALLNK